MKQNIQLKPTSEAQPQFQIKTQFFTELRIEVDAS